VAASEALANVQEQPSIESKIRSFVRDTFFVEDFAGTESFLKTGLIDSMGMLELVTFVEGTFGIETEPSELIPANLDSLENLIAFIERKRSRAP
jgi:acyl carrier protein